METPPPHTHTHTHARTHARMHARETAIRELMCRLSPDTDQNPTFTASYAPTWMLITEWILAERVRKKKRRKIERLHDDDKDCPIRLLSYETTVL